MKVTKNFLVEKILDKFFDNYRCDVMASGLFTKNNLNFLEIRDMLFTRLKNRWSKPDLFFAYRHPFSSNVYSDLFSLFGI